MTEARATAEGTLPRPPRRRDATPVADLHGATISAEPFLGSWCNTMAASDGFLRLDVERRDGDVAVRTLDDRGKVIDWGTALELFLDIAPGRPIAFSVRKDFGAYAGLLQGNLNLGLLVLGTYKTAEAGGVGYFSREFFQRVAPRLPLDAAQPDGGELFADVEVPKQIDAQSMAGRWHNADPNTDGIAEIVIELPDGSSPTVEVLGSVPADEVPRSWGPAEVGVYAAVDEAGHKTLSLLADYRTPELVSSLQLRLPAGALALAGFERFPGRRNPSYFTREFFYRAG